tara:strand:+ start:224 stop:490 length:267 start_codon:yes stop_codon:yes gene_type:complete
MAHKAVATVDGGVHVDLTDAEVAEVEAREAQAVKDAEAYALVKYRDDRKKAYGDIGDQLDMRYKDLLNGTTTWKDHVAKVKSDHPKPE